LGPAEGRERPQRGGKPRVEHILVAAQNDPFAILRGRLALRLFLGLGNEQRAVGTIPGRDLVPPPQLTGDAPWLDLAHPVEKGVLPLSWDKPGAPVLDRRERRSGENTGIAIPLIG